MKKVLVVYHIFAHYREPVLRELASSMEHEYTFVSGNQASHAGLNPLELVTDNDGKAHAFIRLKNRWLGRRILWQSGLLKLLWRGEYDAVIFLGNIHFLTTWLAVLVAKFRRKQILMWTHGLYGSEKPALSWLRCQFYKLADSLLLYGRHAKRLLVKKGISESRLHVIYNSLNVPEQEVLYQSVLGRERREVFGKLFCRPELPTLVFIGRLNPQKKLLLLVDAVAKLFDEHGMLVNLLLVGDGPEHSLLQARVKKFAIADRVHFYGANYDERVNAEFLYFSDVCVAPGEVGLTAMHAMIYGTPVITHDTASKQKPEFEAIESGRSGLFFSEGDLDSLTSTVVEWIRSHPHRAQTRKACREIIFSKYSPLVQRTLIDAAITANLRSHDKKY